MLGSVFAKSLRDQRRGLIGWSIGLAALVAVMAALWPSIRDMPDLERFLANYPEAMRELFDVEAISTGAGFLNAELFSIILPAMFLVFAIGRGARLVAGEEQDGSLEVVLATPVPRIRVLLDKAGALAVSVAALGAALFVATAAAGALAGMELRPGHLAGAALAVVLLGIEHGWLALAVGAATGRRGLAMAVAGSVAGAGYVLYVAAKFVEALRPWEVVSPLHQALDGGPIGAGLPLAYAWMAVGAVVVLALALPAFDRRDVAVA